MSENKDSFQQFVQAERNVVMPNYVLQLYIAGSSQRSRQAVANIQMICENFLKGSYELEIIDIFQQPGLAKSGQIFAVPTLVKKMPIPKRLFIGDMSDTDTIVAALNS